MLWSARYVNKGLLLATAVGMASTGLATPAQACKPRSGGGGFMGGGYAGYQGFGGYPQAYGRQPYAPQYSPPQQAAYQQPAYQQPAPQPSASQPQASQQPASHSPGVGIRLVADKELGESVNYTLDSSAFQMGPGQSQNLDGSKTWTIRFDRGGSFGQAEYSLTSGAYEWVVTDRGWDLRSKTYVVTLDNTRNPNEFNYVISDRQDVVPAGQTKTITSKMPVVITFDRGDGREPARKPLDTGTFHVDVNPTTNLVDVFAGSPPAQAAAPNSVAATSPADATPPPPAPVAVLPPAPAPEPAPTMIGGGN
ncbi:MAG TPA: hypothetical protein VFE78_05580 [Gemmataceae bacterium]|nr:hypothetical protein [Gemmataceae bacterium]